MFELTPDNTAEYLRGRGWLGPEPASVEALGGGVSNVVLRVEQSDRCFIVKQSRPQLRTREDWFSDLERIYREQETMELLVPLLPPGVIPRVLFAAGEDFLFGMESAPSDAQVWKAQLLASQVDPSIAEQAGHLLGQIHQNTAQLVSTLASPGSAPLADRRVFVQLRVEPFYVRVQERRPEVAQAIAPLIEQLLTRQEALCHGDFSPKNLLVHSQGITLVDHETAHFGDPAMDLGFFLSHLLLKACWAGLQRQRYFDLTRIFWAGYGKEVRYQPKSEYVARGTRHLGVCLLARIDGTSPVDYLAQDRQREAVRQLGRALLLRSPSQKSDWEDTLALAEQCYR